jgi:hypothetical protein
LRVTEIEAKIAEHDAATIPPLVPSSLAAIADDLRAVWCAPTIDAPLKKRIVRTVIQEVIADIDADAGENVLLIHWMGGTHTERAYPAGAVANVTAPPPTSLTPSGSWSSLRMTT